MQAKAKKNLAKNDKTVFSLNIIMAHSHSLGAVFALTLVLDVLPLDGGDTFARVFLAAVIFRSILNFG